MSDEFDRDPLADALRASLARHAGDAPSGDVLAERIVRTAVGSGAAPAARPGRRGWRTWTLPLVAAAAVGAVVTSVVAIENYHPEADKAPAAGSLIAPTPLPTPTSTSATTAAPSPRTTAPALHGVRILDLTFAGLDDGWALASADCLNGSGGRCTALLRTTDGTSWQAVPNPEFNVPGIAAGCAGNCVQHLRFANDRVGYAYGPKALFMTTDGGATWRPQAGGAEAIETLNGNVIKVAASGTGCPGPCHVTVATADIGGTRWRSTTLATGAGGVQLSRGGADAYVLLTRNPAGGAGAQSSTLYRSRDNGASWTSLGEPCPQQGGEVDSYAVAAAPAGRVSVLCGSRAAPQQYFVATSTDAGARFTVRETLPAGAYELLTGDPDTVLVAAGTGLERSADGGRNWYRIADIGGTVTFVGFESASVGRVVANDGRMIWTTRDAGRSWRPVTLP